MGIKKDYEKMKKKQNKELINFLQQRINALSDALPEDRKKMLDDKILMGRRIEAISDKTKLLNIGELIERSLDPLVVKAVNSMPK